MNRYPIVLALLLLSATADAQKSYYGIKAGLNIASLKLSFSGMSGSTNDLYSFHGGVYAVFMTSEKFGFQPELLYSAQGAAGSGGSGNFNLNYLTVPVMMRFTFTPGALIQFGPQVGFLMGASVDGQDAKSGMNSVDFGLGFGLGFERPSGVNFGFRYVLGLSNTLSSSTTSGLGQLGLSGITMTNQVIQLSVGYRFKRP